MQCPVDELRNLDFWPSDTIGFVPFVGQHYDQGINGVRVLLLGESHYAKPADETRDLTQNEYKDCELEQQPDVRRSWPIFFRRLDQIVTRSEVPTAAEAAEMWKHVAFANFVQKSVGASAGDRPDSSGWETGHQAFPILLAKLHPAVILVLGRMTFERTPDSGGEKLDEFRVPSSGIPRSLWKMRHEGGYALMSWVYHPSWNKDSQQTRIAVFDELIRRVARCR